MRPARTSLSTSGDRNPRLQAKRRIGEVASCDDTAAAVARCAFSACPVWAPKHRFPVVSGIITRRRSGGRGRWSISNRPLLNPSPCRRGSFSSDLMDASSLFLTANADTIYTLGMLDLSKGPIVLEVGPKMLGAIDGQWFR